MAEVKFESLTPKDDINISSYEEALDFGLSDNTITNIALTGPYGAGKSSVIETYKRNNKEKSFMNISLTHFEGSKTTDTNILEGKIVNQLLHQIDYDKIPQTIFKVKNNTKNSKLWNYTAIFVVFITAALLTFRFQDWKKYLTSSFINENSSKWIVKIIEWLSSIEFNFIVLIIFVMSAILLIYNFIKLQLNKQLLKKITIKGNEVEIFKDREESYFDKFMNDVIYLFTSSEKDIIIFEDLDRFENATIYERLYEINLLINKRLLSNGEDKQIKFVYLIKDDAFNSKDRAKLFDLIIPIVPVIDSSNSFEQFIQVFDDSGISKDFNIKTLRKLSLYIDDMRLLKNISNEYYIYKERLSKVTLDNDKLLATIIYKNLFPKDFSNFQLGLGFINKIFALKNDLIKKRLETLESQLRKIEDEIELSEIESLNSINELDSLFLKVPIDGFYRVNGKKELDYTKKSDFIASIKENGFEVEEVKYRSNYYESGLSFESTNKNISELFELMKGNKEYSARLNNLNNKEATQRINLLNKKGKLRLHRNEISSMSISDILQLDDSDFFNNKTIKTEDVKYLYESPYFDLIILIVREGLIDENYTDYLTYFYENSLSKHDKEFLRGIYDRKPKEWGYKLENIDRLTTDISVDELIRFQILNFDLLIFYMKDRNKYGDELSAIFDNVKKKEMNDFIIDIYEYYKKANNVSYCFEILEEHWQSMIKDLIARNINKRMEIEELIYVSMYYFSNLSILENNSDNIIFGFIEQSIEFERYLESNNISLEIYLKKLSQLNIRFTEIDSKLPQAKQIIEFNLFKLSESNLKEIFLTFELSIDKGFYQDNVTLLLTKNILKKNIYEDKLNEYIEIYLNLADDDLQETSETIIKLLNNKELSDENAIGVINRLDLYKKVEKIVDIKDIERGIMLFDSENILINGENIIEYFILNENKINDNLISIINMTEELISFEKIKSNYDEDTILELYRSFIVENQINTDQYLSMIKSMDFVYKKGFDKQNIDLDKIRGLIESEIITVSSPNVKDIIENYPEVLYAFVLKDIDTFIEIFETNENYNESVLLELIKNQNLNTSEVKRLIDLSSDSISILDYDYSNLIKEYIIQNKFNKADLPDIVSKYSEFKKNLQAVAYVKVLESLDDIIEAKYIIDKKLLLELLEDDQIKNRKLLFAKYIGQININELEYFINKFNLSADFISVLKGKRPKFEIIELNKLILDEYMRRGYINKIHEEDGQYRVYGKKIFKN